MDLDPVILSRIQFAFLISFHIIFPAFTVGLAAWLATIEGLRLFTGNPLYRRVFDFWLKVFAVSFGLGVVTGVVMAFQFGTNWGVLAQKAGSIQGPLLGYETFTAFLLEATFFGVMLLGRDRVSPRFYFFACSGRCSRRSGSSRTTAGCRSRSATPSSTAASFLRTGARSCSDRSSWCAGLTCCSPYS
jgi:cytochrome d ubiquinol oxidase subunit I